MHTHVSPPPFTYSLTHTWQVRGGRCKAGAVGQGQPVCSGHGLREHAAVQAGKCPVVGKRYAWMCVCVEGGDSCSLCVPACMHSSPTHQPFPNSSSHRCAKSCSWTWPTSTPSARAGTPWSLSVQTGALPLPPLRRLRYRYVCMDACMNGSIDRSITTVLGSVYRPQHTSKMVLVFIDSKIHTSTNHS